MVVPVGDTPVMLQLNEPVVLYVCVLSPQPVHVIVPLFTLNVNTLVDAL